MLDDKKVESRHSNEAAGAAAHHPREEIVLTGETSPGVKRIEIISAHFTLFDRIFLFIGVFIVAYVYSLDGTLRYAYQVRHCFPSSWSLRLY